MVGLQSANPTNTPLEVNVKYHYGEGGPLSKPLIYQQLMGSLNCLTFTRPDISFVVQQVILCIIHYLKETS